MKTLLKIFLLCIIILSEVSVLSAQPITWQKVYPDSITEEGQFGIQTFDGDYIILNTVSGGPNSGTYLMDLDQYGNKRWNKKIIQVGYGKCIQQTKDSGFIISGGNSIDQGTLVKVDRNGNFVWNKSYSPNTILFSVKEIDSNNFIACGDGSIFPIMACVMKTDSIGNIIWHKFLDFPGDASAANIIINDDGYIYFTGAIRVNNFYRTLFAKMNSNGDFLWFNYYGSQGQGDSQTGCSIVSESNRYLFITGLYERSFSTEAHFTKIDSSGNVMFQNILPQTNSTVGMCRTSNGFFAIAGFYFTITADDVLLLLLNTEGEVISRKYFNSVAEDPDYPSSIIETSDKGFLIAGTKYYYQDRLVDFTDIFVIKTDSNGNVLVSINNLNIQLPVSSELFQNYPNPFNPNTQIKFDLLETGNIKIDIYDNSGQKISNILNERKNKGTYKLNFDGSNLSSGIYYCKLTSQNYSSTIKMLLLK